MAQQSPRQRPSGVSVVVGGTQGIGREIARRLVDTGDEVVVVGRPAGPGPATAARIGATFIGADVSLLSEVRRLAREITDRYDRLDRLVQTADVIRKNRIDTTEGFEVGFATNYLSRFLLVGLLLDRLRATRGRILHVAAAGAAGRLRLADVPPGAGVGPFRAHGAGQGANDVYGVELAARLAGTGVTVHVANPGAVRTGIRDEINGTRAGRLLSAVFGTVMTVREPDEVARILLEATDRHPEAVLIGAEGQPVRVPKRARDQRLRRALWERTEQLTGQVVLPLPDGGRGLAA